MQSTDSPARTMTELDEIKNKTTEMFAKVKEFHALEKEYEASEVRLLQRRPDVARFQGIILECKEQIFKWSTQDSGLFSLKKKVTDLLDQTIAEAESFKFYTAEEAISRICTKRDIEALYNTIDVDDYKRQFPEVFVDDKSNTEHSTTKRMKT